MWQLNFGGDMAKPESTSLGRRDFLKAATGGAAALAASSSLLGLPALGAQQPAARVSGAPDKLRIDVHAHIYPNEYLDMLDRMGGSATGTPVLKGLSVDRSAGQSGNRNRMTEGPID